MIRIFLADDHTILRAGVRRLLEEQADMEVVGEADNGRDVLTAARSHDWDILILDLTLPEVSGIDCLTALQQWCPELPVLVLSMHAEDQYALRVLRAGANGYVTKGSAPEVLVRAVRRVASGGWRAAEPSPANNSWIC